MTGDRGVECSAVCGVINVMSAAGESSLSAAPLALRKDITVQHAEQAQSF